MSQFRVYRNPRAETKARFPLLLDVQSDLIEDLGTRVVVPLSPETAGRRMTVLMPVVAIDGRKFVMCTPQLAGIPRADIGAQVGNLRAHRDEIMAALDLLVTGI